MTFEVLEKSPEVAPLLVRLYDTHNLYALAGDKDNESSYEELTDIMVDLMTVRLSDKESELITDVLLALMKQAEENLKAALSERIAAMDNAPLRIILALANEDIFVADSILRESPILQDMDLIYIMQSKGVSHGRSISMRHGLSASVIDMLAETEDFRIAVNLCNNDGVNLTERAFGIFAEMAKKDENLARPLLSRDDVPQEIAGNLYEFVGEELKKILQARYGIGAAPAIAIVDEVTFELRKLDATKQEATDALMAFALNQLRRGELKTPVLIATLRRGQYSTFLAQFAVFCGLSAPTAKAMIRQESGKALATACRALDISKADFISLFLLTDRFRMQGKRAISHKELSRIMAMYDSINAEDARRALKGARH